MQNEHIHQLLFHDAQQYELPAGKVNESDFKNPVIYDGEEIWPSNPINTVLLW